MEEVELIVSLDVADVPAIVGVRGANINSMRTMYGVEIYLPPKPPRQRMGPDDKLEVRMTIRGFYDCVFACLTQVHNYAAQGVGNVTLEFLLHKWKVGRIIGPKGATAKGIAAQTRGAYFYLPEKESGSSTVQITGNRLSVQKCYELMLQFVQNGNTNLDESPEAYARQTSSYDEDASYIDSLYAAQTGRTASLELAKSLQRTLSLKDHQAVSGDSGTVAPGALMERFKQYEQDDEDDDDDLGEVTPEELADYAQLPKISVSVSDGPDTLDSSASEGSVTGLNDHVDGHANHHPPQPDHHAHSDLPNSAGGEIHEGRQDGYWSQNYFGLAQAARRPPFQQQQQHHHQPPVHHQQQQQQQQGPRGPMPSFRPPGPRVSRPGPRGFGYPPEGRPFRTGNFQAYPRPELAMALGDMSMPPMQMHASMGHQMQHSHQGFSHHGQPSFGHHGQGPYGHQMMAQHQGFGHM